MRFHQFMGWVAAFLFAAWAFALALSASTFFLVFFIQPSLRYTVVLGHAVVLGLPIFLIFWWKRWVNVFTCICGGVLVAVASGVLSAPTLAERYGLPTVGIFLGLNRLLVHSVRSRGPGPGQQRHRSRAATSRNNPRRYRDLDHGDAGGNAKCRLGTTCSTHSRSNLPQRAA
jgi:hypothetical protein